MDQTTPVIAENVFNGLFGATASGSGEEELLRVGAQYSRQFTGRQVRKIILLQAFAKKCSKLNQDIIDGILAKYFEMKQYNNSKEYVTRMFDSISLRRYLNESSVKIDVLKGR